MFCSVPAALLKQGRSSVPQLVIALIVVAGAGTRMVLTALAVAVIWSLQ